MVDADTVVYNIAVFLTTLFLLKFGADKFIDHTSVVARRTGIPETIIGLITAGGEWEELAVIIAAIARKRPSLAIGNIIGSAISNILGAFSLGLLFHDKNEPVRFDHSSRIYSLVLLLLTTFTTSIAYISTKTMRLFFGSILIVSFAIYIASVGWAIGRGTLIAPENSDSEDSEDSEDSDDSGGSTRSRGYRANDAVAEGEHDDAEEDSHNFMDSPHLDRNGERTPCLETRSSTTQSLSRPGLRRYHTLRYHTSYLLLGFLTICLAGYVLSHAATTIIDEFNISDVLFGVVILAIATTLPEKFVAVMSGHRGRDGVLVANTAGSNIFLLTLCSGIVMLDTRESLKHDNVTYVELGVLWASTVVFTAAVWFGTRFCRLIGCAMMIAYIAFIVLEVTVIHSVANSGGN